MPYPESKMIVAILLVNSGILLWLLYRVLRQDWVDAHKQLVDAIKAAPLQEARVARVHTRVGRDWQPGEYVREFTQAWKAAEADPKKRLKVGGVFVDGNA